MNDFLKSDATFAVVGDTMIDEYYQVKADRISPEFPIPVMVSEDQKPYLSLPGGAANVVRQFGENTKPFLYGFSSEASENIFTCCNGTAPHTGLLVSSKVAQVPIKKRFYQSDFPLFRWDVESKLYGEKEENLERIRKALYYDWLRFKPTVTIFSDYDKGFFNTSWRFHYASTGYYRWHGHCITIVDPKKGSAKEWEGCTIFKPNQKEAEEMTGVTDWKKQTKILQRQTKAKCVIITQGGAGVVARIGEDELFEYRPKKTVKASSVIGAGDCFVAFLAMVLGKNVKVNEKDENHRNLFDLDYRKAIEIAFEAGALYVQNQHCQPVVLESKYEVPKNRDFKLAFANGCFDVLHEGHIDLLQYARSTADKLIVAVNSDASVKRLKGESRPINNLKARMKALAALSCVDYVVAFEEDTPLELIRHLKPDTLVKGGDYTMDQVVGKDLVENVFLFPTVPGYSTTNTIEQF